MTVAPDGDAPVVEPDGVVARGEAFALVAREKARRFQGFVL